MKRGIWYTRPPDLYRFLRFLLANLGRLSDHIDWRFGRPYKADMSDLLALLRLAKPGSIVLTHTDYNLCNSLIPGRWDHATLVSAKGRVLEATREGVHESSFSKLLSHCDAVCILEPMFGTEEQANAAVSAARSQIGKPYDYDFEYRLEGGTSYYCSELCWWSWDSALKPLVAPFQPRYVLGAWTLSPQDIRDSDYFKVLYESPIKKRRKWHASQT